jgi:hypothetical protein
VICDGVSFTIRRGVSVQLAGTGIVVELGILVEPGTVAPGMVAPGMVVSDSTSVVMSEMAPVQPTLPSARHNGSHLPIGR